uniref:Uncharacterized protein n=1 Tax=Entomoneis paludosa TaxID=265537 RepID=A0A7S3DMA8_9STRA|mmetsp:Transcript_20900/g.43689  ORF Transcript_20900/g.43689 Transcript_20900/m.43689 type:complete len:286 (+) Transcript_20900:242-1099(+)
MKTLSQRKQTIGSSASTTPVAQRNKRNVTQWKDQVRQACLRRAMQSKLRRKRPLQSNNLQEPLQSHLSSSSSPRAFLEDELRLRGVNVESPILVRETHRSAQDQKPDDVDMMDEALEEHEAYTMTEDEFIDLLEEIEAELKTRQLEEELDREEEMMQDHIAAFESVEEPNETSSCSSICPLCQGRTLLLSYDSSTGTSIVSCNRLLDTNHQTSEDSSGENMQISESCPFLLAGIDTLSNLQQRVEVAQTTHADFCSNPSLQFSNPSPSSLSASCQMCEMTMMLYG